MKQDATVGSGLVQHAERVLRPVENAAAILGGAMMFTAMTLTTLDALMRYLLNNPLSFNYFFTENYMLVGMVCLPMAWGFRTGGYIRITFLLSVLPTGVGNMLMRVGLLAGAVLCADMAILGGLNWYESYITNKVEIEVVNWPWHMSWIWVPIGVGLLTLRLIVLAFGPASQLNIAHAHEEDAV